MAFVTTADADAAAFEAAISASVHATHMTDANSTHMTTAAGAPGAAVTAALER
jgi:hypothetical protein